MSTAGAIRTTCPYCGVGCGVLATPRAADGSVTIAGDPAHPANLGRLCSKGSALAETLSLDDRLLHPLIHGTRSGWDAALGLVAQQFRETIAAHGPDSVALYVSGQLLTEDYYVANKLMKGFVGSANIDTNSRLCMASSVAGHRRAFGSDTVPGCYDDLELADLVVLVGSNLAWCHPVLLQRLAAARAASGTKIVVIDPRRTATCEIADLHLALAPDSDVALFNGLLRALLRADATDHGFISGHTTGFDDAAAKASAWTLGAVAAATGLSLLEIAEFYGLFTGTQRVVTVYSQGVNQSVSGTDKVNAIINVHLATRRIGRPGMGPFSVTGQPNAMGGREVGGLANMLAAHMDIENAAHRDIVQAYWRSPRIATKPGLKAIDMFRAVADGRIKAIWILATNPVDSMPEADTVRAALRSCPFVVVSDVARHTDTTTHAHVLLPSLAWGEKDGTVTNSERRISRQRAFLPPPGEARAEWWQIAQVAARMGFADAFAYDGPPAIFAEHAALTGVGNGGTRDLDISACAGLTKEAYDALAPFQWPRPAGSALPSSAAPSNGGEPRAPLRFFAEGGFYTPDRRARFVATIYRGPGAGPIAAPGERYPFVLNTGRIRDQWHTMTRTGKAPRLLSHAAEPFVEVHPEDAARLGLAPAGIARLSSPHGHMLARVVATDRQRPSSVFVPMHWTDQLAGTARVNALITATVDAVSGQPALKQSNIAVTPYPARWFAVAVCRERPHGVAAAYWAIAPVKGGWRIELADQNEPASADGLLHGLLAGRPAASIDVVAYGDQAARQQRAAAFVGGEIQAIIYMAPEPVAVSRTWLCEQFAAETVPAGDRLCLLAGRPGAGQRDPGPIVCACYGVGRNDIACAVTHKGCTSVAAIGTATSAGTNCGSCREEIARLIRHTTSAQQSPN